MMKTRMDFVEKWAKFVAESEGASFGVIVGAAALLVYDEFTGTTTRFQDAIREARE